MQHAPIRSGLTVWIALWLVGCGSPQPDAREAQDAQEPEISAEGPGRVVIRMTDDMRFVPPNPVISPGDTVVWINDGSLPHTATDNPGTAAVPANNILPQGAEPWDSGSLDAGQRFEHVPTAAGEYTYVCVLHEAAGMIGRLTVE
ncbi:MAG: plastocyanin/azurin family copper-binding protein [Gemmatimonadota bacterium]